MPMKARKWQKPEIRINKWEKDQRVEWTVDAREQPYKRQMSKVSDQ